MKNPFTLFLIVFIVMGSAAIGGSALAEDFLIGQVVSADISRMEIEIAPIPVATGPSRKEKKTMLKVKVTAGSLIVNGRGKRVFPGCVYPGGIVRLWGRREGGVFTVTDIRGPGPPGKFDPTGVRRRLHRGRWQCPDGTDCSGRRP